SGVASRLLALGGQTDNRLFNGTARGWNTARPCLPIAAIMDGGIANPIILLDELDKAGGSDSNGRIHDSLLELLEPSSARRYYDEYLCGHADLAHLSWVATANEINYLPRTLLDRFQVLRVDAPEPAHYPAIVRRTVAAFIARRGLHPAYVTPFDEAEWRWLAQQFGSPRQIKRATELLLSHRLLRPSGPSAIH
ncbi:MAG: AAA family ATPase, partial [Candidatus Competibacter denitrificans]